MGKREIETNIIEKHKRDLFVESHSERDSCPFMLLLITKLFLSIFRWNFLNFLIIIKVGGVVGVGMNRSFSILV